ncbi:polyamine oxidase-like [Paramuricea clavata]|uniref:Polyamine oxidase-like n=1 Tax=Paramuricea clavata TaxID=317549 RepID=A0A7D9ENP9_PARCT|nr:polyamine oxidase-like [Paramuricea clavata]
MFLTFSACFLLVLAVALEDNSTKRSAGEQESEKYNVLILGAGISAAKTLYDAGITNFRVLEATTRIGGRLLVKDFGGAAIELGGNWVHGTDNNPIWALVQQAGLSRVDTMIEPTEGQYIVLDENGTDVTSEDGHKEMESVSDCLDKLIEEQRAKKAPDFSVRDGLATCKWVPKHPA